jgi:hypothetical protein
VRDVLHLEHAAVARADQFEPAPQHRQHAQRQHVDLHQAQLLEVVLVPLDHAALGHRRVLDRHQARQFALGDDEAARMLRQVARKAEQLLGQRGPLPGQP